MSCSVNCCEIVDKCYSHNGCDTNGCTSVNTCYSHDGCAANGCTDVGCYSHSNNKPCTTNGCYSHSAACETYGCASDISCPCNGSNCNCYQYNLCTTANCKHNGNF